MIIFDISLLVTSKQVVMIDQYNYHCPYCKAQLNNENNEVEFLIRRKNKDKVKLFLLPTPYTYGYRTIPVVNFNKNEEVDFNCKSCLKSLISSLFPNYVQIHLKITDKVFLDVFFSSVYGVHKTYVGLEDFMDTYGKEMSDE